MNAGVVLCVVLLAFNLALVVLVEVNICLLLHKIVNRCETFWVGAVPSDFWCFVIKRLLVFVKGNVRAGVSE